MPESDFERGFIAGWKARDEVKAPPAPPVKDWQPTNPNWSSPWWPAIMPQTGAVGVGCAVCGMKLDGGMGYVCSNNKCPTRVTSVGVK